ncbi:HAD family hydrolase [Microbacterium sp. A204]|uniref:HAD family hydrolase n=1 Tax=Microbacterium sp. A204 TaxID=3457321 RepID=UPI003FD4F208
MTTHFDAVIFDCDGVLIDSELLSMRTSQRMLADLGWEADVDELMDLFAGSSREFFDSEVERRINRKLDPDWRAPYRGWIEKAFRDELTAVPGIVSALERITLPIAVASNSDRARIHAGLEVVGLLPRFVGKISGADDVQAGKPAPDVYLHAAASLRVAPERCIAIDDSRFGVEAAQRAGMFVLAYSPEGHADPRLDDHDRTMHLDDLHRLPEVLEQLVNGATPSATASSPQ